MSTRPHVATVPLRPLPSRTPWVLIDPGLHADLVAAYRAGRLLLLALFALLGNPARSSASGDRRADETEILRTEEAPYETSRRLAADCFKQSVERLAKDLPRPLVTLHCSGQNAQRVQLVCLKMYRAHAPPPGEIPNEFRAPRVLPADRPSPRTLAAFAAYSAIIDSPPAVFLTSLHSSRTLPVNTAPPHLDQIHLVKGDNCHVCC